MPQAALDLIINLQDNASASLERVSGQVSRLGSLASGALRVGAVAAAAGVAAIGTAAIGAVSAGLSFNSSMEQVHAQLMAFTKDGEKANQILDMIRERAARTPFAFEEMARATAGLIPAANMSGQSLESLVEKAEILAASNPAEGLEGAAFALREAVSGDFTSIIERFNLPRQYINELKEQGVPALEIVSRAMQQMGYDTSLVTNLAETASGRWSTLKDTLVGLAGTATQPLFEGLSQSLASVQQWLDSNQASLQAIATTIGQGLATAFQWLTETAIPALIAGWNLIQPAFAGLVSFLSTTVVPLIQQGLGAAFQWIATSVIPPLITAWNAIQPALANVGTSFQSMVSTVQPLVESMSTTIQQRWQILSGLTQSVFSSIGSIVQSVFGIISGFVASHGQQIVGTLTTAWNGIQTVINVVLQTISTVIQTIFGAVATFLQRNSGSIQSFLSTAWTTISSIITTSVELIQAIVIPIFSRIASFIASHKDTIVNLLTAGWNIISNVIQGVLTIIQGVIKTVLQIIQGDWSGAWETIKSTVSSVTDNIRGIIDGALNGIKEIFQLSWDAIVSIVTGVGKRLYDAGQSVVNMLRDGISNAWEGLKSWFSDKLGELRDMLPFSEPKDASSPLRGLAESGAAILENIARGIPKGAAILNTKLIDALKNVADLIIKSVDALGVLARYDGGAAAVVGPFAEHLGSVVQAIQDVARQFSSKALEHAATFSDAAGKIVAMVGGAVEALSKLASGAIRDIPGTVLQVLVGNITRIVQQIEEAAEGFRHEGVEAATAFSDAAGKIVGMIGTSFDTFTKLASGTIRDIPGTLLQVLVGNITRIVQQIEEAAEGFQQAGLEAATAFSDAASKIIGVIGAAIEAFLKLRDYDGVAPSRMQAIATDMEAAGSLMVEVAERANVEGVEQAGQFSEALGRVFALFKAGVEAMDAIREYQMVPRERMTAVLADFDAALRLMLQVTTGANVQGVSIAAEFANAARAIFDSFKAGVAALDAIREYQGVPPERMHAFFNDFLGALGTMAALNERAAAFRDGAHQFARLVSEAADAIKSAAQSLRDIGSMQFPQLPSVPAAAGVASAQPASAAAIAPATAQPWRSGMGGGGTTVQNNYYISGTFNDRSPESVADRIRLDALLRQP